MIKFYWIKSQFKQQVIHSPVFLIFHNDALLMLKVFEGHVCQMHKPTRTLKCEEQADRWKGSKPYVSACLCWWHKTVYNNNRLHTTENYLQKFIIHVYTYATMAGISKTQYLPQMLEPCTLPASKGCTIYLNNWIFHYVKLMFPIKQHYDRTLQCIWYNETC